MSEVCFHCREPIPQGFRAELVINGENKAFCCYGCQAIAETIVTGGLASFYQHRTRASDKPDDFNQQLEDELKLYDDAELQAEFVEIKGDISETSLSIGGITCAACIWLLEKEVSRLEGVLQFSVNHTTHKAQLRWKQAQTPLSEILIRIRKLGYKGFPYEEGLARQYAEKERKTTVFRIAVAGIASMQNMMFALPLYLGFYSGITSEFISLFRWVSLVMCLPVILFSAVPFFRTAWRDMKTRHLTMDVPVSIAILGAFFASAWITMFGEASLESDVYFDSVSMFTFFLLLGRFIEMQTRHKHLNSDVEMSRLLPGTAVIRIKQGTEHFEKSIAAHKLALDDILLVKQGQIIAADGVVIEGKSRVDESALSGEFLPVEKTPGSFVSGGTTNIENSLYIRVTAKPKDSRVSAIIRLLDKAQLSKPKTVIMADKIASFFVARVILVSVAVGLFWFFYDSDRAFPIVLSVLVVTCPCALGLATPTALTCSNIFMRAKGFLITRSHALEAMPQITDIIFDKTGTLTKGKLSLRDLQCFGELDKSQALEIAAALEAGSNHPIALAFKPYFKKSADAIENEIGKGLSGIIQNNLGHATRYFLGSAEYVNLFEQQLSSLTTHEGLNLYLTDGKNLLAHFMLNDSLREDSKETVQAFKDMGLMLHILSGDQPHAVKAVATELGIDSYQAAQSPEDKLSFVKNLQDQGKKIAMIGDGINDLPVLSGAKLSIAMGNASDITKLNADAILLNGQLKILHEAFLSAAKTRKIIRENMTWALVYNTSMLPLAAAGFVPPYIAALGMSMSSLIVVFNSLRLKR
jgi:Cu2+-exporting ATPase